MGEAWRTAPRPAIPGPEANLGVRIPARPLKRMRVEVSNMQNSQESTGSSGTSSSWQGMGLRPRGATINPRPRFQAPPLQHLLPPPEHIPTDNLQGGTTMGSAMMGATTHGMSARGGLPKFSRILFSHRFLTSFSQVSHRCLTAFLTDPEQPDFMSHRFLTGFSQASLTGVHRFLASFSQK